MSYVAPNESAKAGSLTTMPHPNMLEALADKGLSSKSVEVIVNALFSYYLRLCRWSSVIDTAALLEEEITAPEIREVIPVDYRLFSMKMAIVDMVVNGTSIEDAIHNNDVEDVDAPVIEMAVNLPFFADVPKDLEYKTPKETKTLVNDTIKELTKLTRAFIFRKMRFLTMSQGHSAEDFLADFRARQIHLIYTRYPALTGLHLLNTLRGDIKNFGANQIAYWTSSKRQDLHEEDGVYRFREQNIDYFSSDASDKDSENSVESLYDNVIDRDSILSLIDKRGGYQSELLRFLAFQSPRSEREFIRRYGRKTDQSCEDIYDRDTIESYAEKVRGHLRLPPRVYTMIRASIARDLS